MLIGREFLFAARTRKLFASTALVTAVCLPSLAQAQSIWGGAGSSTTTNDYTLGTNWSNGTPPTAAGQSAQFGDGGAGPASAYITTGLAAITPDSWTFTATSQSYTIVGEEVNFNGTGPNLVNNANAGQSISISVNMTGDGISQAGASTLSLSGTNSFTTTSITAGTLVNSGSLTSAITNSSTFTNNSEVVGDVTNSGTFANNGTVTGGVSQSAGSTTNAGTITSTVSLTGGSFTNNVDGQVQGATTNNGGTFDNNAAMAGVTNTSGTFNNNNGGTITTLTNDGGTFANNTGASVTGAATVSAGSVTNAGTFASTLDVTGGSFTNNANGQVQGTTTNNGGTITNSGGSFADVTNTSGTFDNTTGTAGAVSNAGTATNGGTIASLSNTGGTFGNTGTVSGASTVSGGAVTNAGTFASTLDVSGGTFTNNANGEVQGTTTNNGGAITNNGGTFADVTNTSGTFDNTTGTAGAVSNAGTATNGGTIASLSNTGGTFGNTGTVSGASTVSDGAVTNTGTFASTLDLTGGVFTNNTGGQVQGTTTNNGGTITNSGGSFADVTNTSGTFNNTTGTAGAVSNAGTATNGGTIASLSNTGGTFGNSGAVTGASTVSGGAVTNTGTFASTLDLTGGTFTNNAGGQVQDTTTNNGGAVTNNGGTFADVTNTSGTFTNTSGTIAGPVTNGGTFNANGGAINGLISNTGTFNVGGAVTSNNTFTNGGQLVVLVGGSYSGVTTLTNIGSVAVASTGTLNATNISNRVGGTISNSGTVTTSIDNAGTFSSQSGAVFKGTFTNDVSGIANMQGTINGTVFSNMGSVFNVTGALSTNGAVTVNNAAQLKVTGGDFTGITTLSNNAANSTGISVSAGRTLAAANLINASGATIENLGAITTTTTVNNGSITGAYAMAGGTLSGTGTTQNLTVNGGTFAPGDGTAGSSMTVFQSLVLGAASTYLIQINPATSSFASASGAVTLNGGAVSANFANGSYVAKRYTILTGSAVDGTFGSVTNTNLPGGFKSSLSYDTTHAYLDLALIFAPPPGSGLSGNQQAVGNAVINYFNTNGSIPLAFGGLTASTLSQASGELATGSQQSTFNAMNQFMGLMTDPFIAGRQDPLSAGTAASGFAEDEGTRRKPTDAMAAIYRKAPLKSDTFAQRWSVWAAGFGGSQTTNGNAASGSSNTSSSLYGTAVGADYWFSRYTQAGFALAGGGTNFSVANGLGSGRSDMFQAGAFVRHTVGAAYLSGALAYGWQDVTTNRTLTIAGIDQLRAKFNANAWSGRVEGGYRFVSQGLGWTPYAAGQFATFDLPGYAETVVSGANTFALAYAAKSVTATRSELGVRADKSFAMEEGLFTLRGRAAWAHDYNTDRNVSATFRRCRAHRSSSAVPSKRATSPW